ncbi:AI-2E family transporter [Fulvimarina endophytica]|uniref:AI-2E family transporter n=1 Tax=Fulvimarina endophytica TaxID=2293836 RepID=A0A371X859_9HYPH|nr:AI-2E family transporter [Fulvimarina endophytica]RFC65407.1 AI-2E family transporter [Fulvimarina endophytica]
MQSDIVRNRLLAILAGLAVIAAVKIGYPVLMPIVVSFCIIASAWPIKRWTSGIGSPALSYTLTIVILVAGVTLFFGVISYALTRVAQNFVEKQDDFQALFDQYGEWAQANGLPTLSGDIGGFDRVASLVRSILGDAYTVLSYMGVVAVIVVLGFPEVPKLARKFRREFETEERYTISQTVGEMADAIRSYLAMTMVTSFITGLVSFAWAFALGLDMALIWGILNFLLNFVPVIGNVIGILPPTLYAFIQFGGWVMPLVVFAGFVVLQLTISNFIYPMLQARGVSLPPVTIILSLLFWGWIWGVAGGLLAVPLTAMLVIVCSKFEATRKFAVFVGGDENFRKTGSDETKAQGAEGR